MADLWHNHVRRDLNAHTLETMEKMKHERREQSDFYFAIKTHHKKTIDSIMLLVRETMNTLSRGSGREEMRLYKTNFDIEVRRFAIGIHAYETMVRKFLMDFDEFFRQVPCWQIDREVLVVYEHEVAAQNTLQRILAHDLHTNKESKWPFPIL